MNVPHIVSKHIDLVNILLNWVNYYEHRCPSLLSYMSLPGYGTNVSVQHIKENSLVIIVFDRCTRALNVFDESMDWLAIRYIAKIYNVIIDSYYKDNVDLLLIDPSVQEGSWYLFCWRGRTIRILGKWIHLS